MEKRQALHFKVKENSVRTTEISPVESAWAFMEYGIRNTRFPGRAEFLRVARPSMKAVQGIGWWQREVQTKKRRTFFWKHRWDGWNCWSIYRSYQCVCVPVYIYIYMIYIWLCNVYFYMIVFRWFNLSAKGWFFSSTEMISLSDDFMLMLEITSYAIVRSECMCEECALIQITWNRII